MKNKFFILFILIFMFGTGSVFAVSGEQMTIEIAQDLLDFMKENLVITAAASGATDNSNALSTLNQYSAEEISNSFNINFYNKFESFTELENEILLENITCYFAYKPSSVSLYFIISNNSYPNDNPLAFQKLQQNTGNVNQFQITSYGENTDYIYGTFVNIQTNGLYWQSASKIEGNSTSRLFTNFIPIIEPEFNEDNSIIYLPYQFSLSGAQEVYYNINTDNPKFYIIGNGYEVEFEPVYPPSGDTGSGDTGGEINPSGDTGTTTPDYNEKLDNIQGSIDNVNQNLDNIENKIPTSGEVQNVISGTLENAFGEGSGEVTSEQIDNLQNDVNEIMGDIVPANNFIGMFNQIITAFSEALLGQGEEIIEFDHRGEHYVISSNQVNLPIAEIKAFLSIFFNVAIVMAMALTISWIIRRMEEGDLISVLHMGDADMYFYEDLNLF